MNATLSVYRFLRLAVVIALVAVLFSAEPVDAGPMSGERFPTLSVHIGDEPNGWAYSAAAGSYRDGKHGGYALALSQEFPDVLDGRASIEVRELEFDPDPFVLNNLLVTNISGMTQTFNATVTLPTVFGGPNVISGNVRTSVIDGGTDGATVATTGGLSVYRAQIDGSTVATLQADPFSLVAPVAGSNTLAATFGPSVSGAAVTSDIGIVLRFTLTAGDTAAILSRFDVVAVPEPSAAAIGCIGCVIAMLMRRHQR